MAPRKSLIYKDLAQKNNNCPRPIDVYGFGVRIVNETSESIPARKGIFSAVKTVEGRGSKDLSLCFWASSFSTLLHITTPYQIVPNM